MKTYLYGASNLKSAVVELHQNSLLGISSVALKYRTFFGAFTVDIQIAQYFQMKTTSLVQANHQLKSICI